MSSEVWNLAKGIAILVLVGFLMVGASKSSEQEHDGTPEATVEIHEFVTNMLKSPSSADFPWDDVIKTQHRSDSPDTYELSSYVDSQNGFGAIVRTHYTAVVRKTGSNWQLVRLTTW